MTQHCPNPFEWLDITAWNDTDVKFSLCIESWAGEGARLAIMPIAEAAEIDIMELWNGEKARKIRSNAIDHDCAKFCIKCPNWEAGQFPVVQGRDIERSQIAPPPKVLNLAYDRSCDLACPSCRTEHMCHEVGSVAVRNILRFQDNIVRPLLKTADMAYVAGLGDPFASLCYFRLLQQVKQEDAQTLKWGITTNGRGFTPENYYSFPTSSQIDTVHFSIDAATDQTYQVNRSNVGWHRVLKNLAFAGSLREAGVIRQLEISMVIQENNCREAVQFVELANGHHVDVVKLSALLPQGTFTDLEYASRAVHLKGHPRHDDAMEAISNAREFGKANGINVTWENER